MSNKTHTFRVELREVSHAGGQITADVIRDDGKVVRSGMWPDLAEQDCELLNKAAAEGWMSSQYFAARAARMRNR